MLVRSTLSRSSLRRSGSASSSTPASDAIAAWDLSLVRYFLVDNDAGDDANIGYVDAAAGATLTPAGIAKKTITGTSGLLSILPKTGNARRAVILLKSRAAGATYLNPSAVAEGLDLTGIDGYAGIWVRGSTDLTNTVADRITLGAMVAAAGPNGDSSWTVAAGATTSVFAVSAGALPAEPTLKSGVDTSASFFRVRFTGNVTAALANVCRETYRVAGGNTITVGDNLAVAPAAGDTFFIERPGVRLASYFETDQNGGPVAGLANNSQGNATVGIAVVATAARQFLLGNAGTTRYTFCDLTSAAPAVNTVQAKSQANILIFAPAWIDETSTSRDVGIGLRCAIAQFVCNTVITLSRGIYCTGTLNTTSQTSYFIQSTAAQLSGAGYYGNGVSTRIASAGNANNCTFGNNASGTSRRTRITGNGQTTLGSLNLQGFQRIRGVEFELCGAAPCIEVGGATAASQSDANSVYLDDCVNGPAGGNTGVGIKIGAALRNRSVLIGIANACTVSGTAGEIMLGDGAALTTYAALTRTNVVDSNGNDVQGTGGHVVNQCALVSNQSGGALAVGDVVRSNGTAAQVTSAQADTLANSAAVGVMVTPPASLGSGYMAVAGAPSVNFSAPPTPGAVAYLSTSTIRVATTTLPAISGTQQLVKLGRVQPNGISGSTARVALNIDVRPENAFDPFDTIVEVTDTNATFSLSQTVIVVTGAITANRTFPLPPLASVITGQRFTLKDMTSSGAFDLIMDGDGAETIDLQPTATLTTGGGSRGSLTVRKTPTQGWMIE